MATDKRFVVKNGLQTENINFVFNDSVVGSSNITATMLSSNVLSFSGSSGQLFSIADTMTGVIFSVNDISGVPSIEVYDDGRIRMAESFGNVIIGNSAINTTRASTSTTTGILQVAGGAGIQGNIYVGGVNSFFGGNVGIGTNNAVAQLEVYNPTSSKINLSSAGAFKFRMETDGVSGYLRSLNSTYGVHGTPLEINLNTGIATFGYSVSINGPALQLGNNSHRIYSSTNELAITNTIADIKGFKYLGNVPENTLVMNANGAVGVGTTLTLTGAKLTVIGGNINLSPTGSATGYGIVFPDGTFQTTAFSGIATPSFGAEGTVQIAGAGNTFTGDTDTFFWDNANKRLGIGTGAPSNTLSVWGQTPAWFNTSNGSDVFEIRVGNTTTTAATLGYASSTLNPYAYFRNVGGTNGVAVVNNGSVGIKGITNPQSALDVGGAVAIGTGYAGVTAGPTNGLAVQGSVGIGTTNPSEKLTVDGGAATTSIKLVGQSRAAFIGQDATGLSIYQTGNFPIYFQTNGSERVRINGSGNVGIGTTLPISPLHIAYNGIGNTSTDGIVLENNTDATAGQQQWSPRIRLSSEGLRTGAPSVSNKLDWIIENRSTAGSNSGTGIFALSYQTSNLPGYKTKFSIVPGDTDGGGTSAYLDSNSGAASFYIRGNAENYGLLIGSNPSGSKFIQSYESQPLIINEAGNNVGIGVNPGSRLDVNGNASFRSAISVAGIASVGSLISNSFVNFGQNVTISSTNASISTTTGALVVAGGVGIGGNVNAGGSVHSFQGRVGVGTTTSGFTLDVNGTLRFMTYARGNDNGSAYIVGTAIGPNTPVYSFVGSTASGMTSLGSDTGLKFIVNSGEKVRISQDGTVGIGTTTAGSMLDVNGTASFRSVMSVAGATSVASLVVNAGTYTNTLNVNTTANVNALTSNTGITVSTGGITVTGISTFTGNVNIAGNLNVAGTINTQNANVLIVNDPIIYLGEGNTSNLWDLGLVANYNDGTYEHTGFVRNRNDGVWTLFDTMTSEPNISSGNINWADSTLTFAAMKLGNLTVAGNTRSTSSSTGSLVINGVGGVGVGGNVYAGGNVVAGSFQPTSASIPGAGMYLPVTNVLGLSTNGFERMRVASNGYVGIGTNSPSRNLHVEGTALIGSEVDNIFGSLKVRMHRDGGYAAEIYKVGGGAGGSVLNLESESGSGTYLIRGAALGNDRFWFRENGNGFISGSVGIGTTSPSTRLHITGDMSLRSNIGNGDHDIVFGTTQVWNNPIAGRIKGTLEGSTSGYALGSLRFHTAGGTAAADIERMRINQNGDVGIGTTVPLGKLDVTGTIFGKGGTAGAQFDALTLFHTPFANGNTVDAITIRNQFNDTVNNPTVATQILTGKDAAYQNGPTRSAFLAFHARQADALYERMRISSFGNVLIGTTTRASNASSTIVVQGSGTNGSGIQFSNVNVAGAAINTGGSNSLVLSTYTGAVGSETYAERMRMTSSGDIGIGTASPANRLSVYGSAGSIIGFNGGQTGVLYSDANRVALYDGAGANGLVTYPVSNYMFIQTNSVERVRITSGGSVGIGTTAPTSVFEAVANSAVSTSTGVSFRNLASTNNYRFEFGVGYPGYYDDAALFRFANTLAGYISSTGQWNMLTDVAIAANKKFTSLSSGSSQLNLYDASGNTVLSSLNALILGSGSGNERMRIDATGNVGIGSAVSVAGSMFVRDLTVNAAIQTAGTLTVNALVSNVYGLFGQNVTINSSNASTSTTTGALVVAGGVGVGGNINAGGTVHSFQGNVGIGAVLPVSQLHITTDNGALANRGLTIDQHNTGAQAALANFRKSRGTLASPTTVANGDYTGAFTFQNYDGSAYRNNAGFGARVNGTVASNSVPTDLYFWAGSTDDADPYNNNTVRMVISSNGRVGIGSTAPTKPLDVQVSDTIRVYGANVGHIGVTIQNTSANGKNFRLASYADATAANSSFRIRDDSAGSDRMVIDLNGNVGVGTTAPLAGLDVYFSGNQRYRMRSASANSESLLFFQNATTGTTSSSGVTVGLGGDNNGYLYNYYNSAMIFGTNNAERMRITPTGSVGIGSTIPASILDVIGTTTTRGLRSQNFQLGQEHQIEVNGTNGAWNAGIMFGATNTNNRGLFNFQVDTGALRYSTSSDASTYAERMRITQAGLVGIGSTIPTATLDVNGVIGGWGGYVLNGTPGGPVGAGKATSAQTRYISGGGTADGFYTNVPTGGSHQWGVNEVWSMKMDSAGNVGIGTSTITTGYRLQVRGGFAATTKSFVIDHPTKSGMKLRYGSLESPYHGIRLTGKSTVINGMCKVDLPDYIYNLVTKEDVNIQLTNIGHGKILWVGEINVDKNMFTVKSDYPEELDFFWCFTAVRKDIEPMIVEYEE